MNDEPADPGIEALLKFEPAPRKRKTSNGWTPALQRRFIALLAETGSPAKAAEALGRCRFGAEKLYKAEGADSFRAAWDRAIEIAEERIAAERAAERAQWSGVRPPGGVDRRRPGPPPRHAEPEWEPEQDAEDDPVGAQAWLDGLLTKYWHKVVAERKARLNGEIAAADFYLRQMTAIEIAVDLASSDGRALEQFQRLRRDDHHLTEIAETPFSRILDEMRRHVWRAMGEPERPAPPPRHLLVEHDGFSTEPLEFTRGGIDLSHEEQLAVFKQAHERAALEQAEWEARAVAESAAWRERLSTERSDAAGI